MPKTTLFINSQAEQFSNVRKKKIIVYLDSTAKPTTYGKRFQIEHYRKCLTSVKFDLWFVAELYFSYIFLGISVHFCAYEEHDNGLWLM